MADGDDGTPDGSVLDDAVPELVVMVGPQDSGKSTWVRRHLARTHVVVSKDHWPNARRREARQRRVVAEALAAGRSVVVDNTNPAPEDRAALVELARAHGATAPAVHLDVPLTVCLARNEGREGATRVPLVGVLASRRRLAAPVAAEGFDRVDVFTPGAREAVAPGAGHPGTAKVPSPEEITMASFLFSGSAVVTAAMDHVAALDDAVAGEDGVVVESASRDDGGDVQFMLRVEDDDADSALTTATRVADRLSPGSSITRVE